MPFLRLTRDRRGFEHTFLLHADAAGETPRVLYWYRTAPGVLIGRPALDEEAIRSIEEQHPQIDFDWPAILALREAMPPEEEESPQRPVRRGRPGRRDAGPRGGGLPPPREAPEAPDSVGMAGDEAPVEATPTTRHLLEDLVGREIATRLRARHAEIMARIREQALDETAMAAWAERADALNPDMWLTPDAVLAGVRDADRRFEELRTSLLADRGGPAPGPDGGHNS